MPRVIGPLLANAVAVVLGTLLVGMVSAAFGLSALGQLLYSEAREGPFRAAATSPGLESAGVASEVAKLTGARPSSTEVVVLVDTPLGSGSPLSRERVARAARTLKGIDGIDAVSTTAQRPELASVDGRRVAITASIGTGIDPKILAAEAQRAFAHDAKIVVGGAASIELELHRAVRADLRHAIGWSAPLLIVAATAALGSFWASLLLLTTATLVISLGASALRAVDAVWPLSIHAVITLVTVGAGLAAAHSIVLLRRLVRAGETAPWRDRQIEREVAGGEPVAQLARVIAPAARTVLLSGLTATAISAILVAFRSRAVWSMGLGAMVAAALATVVPVVLIAALSRLAGPALRGDSPRSPRASFPEWWSATLSRRAVPLAVVGSALLLAGGVISTTSHFGRAGSEALPPGTPAQQVAEDLRGEFPGVRPYEVYLLADGDAGATAEFASLRSSVGGVPGVQVESGQYLSDNRWLIRSSLASSPGTQAGADSLEALRALPQAMPFEVGGEAAEIDDLQRVLGSQAPWVAISWALVVGAVAFAVSASVSVALSQVVLTSLMTAATIAGMTFWTTARRPVGIQAATDNGWVDIYLSFAVGITAIVLAGGFTVLQLSQVRDQRRADPRRQRQPVGEREPWTGRELVARLRWPGAPIAIAAVVLAAPALALLAAQTTVAVQIGAGLLAIIVAEVLIVRALVAPALCAVLPPAGTRLPPVAPYPARHAADW